MGCETSQDRFAACKSLLDYGFANYAVYTPALPGPVQIPVKLGTQDQVTVIPADGQPLLVEKGQKNLIQAEVTLDPEVTAPVSTGQRLGTMTLRAGQQTLAEIPLVAESAVSRLSYWQIFSRLFRMLAFG